MTSPQTPWLLLLLLLSLSILTTPSSSSTDSFIFGGCSQQKYTPGSAYENAVNSMLTSLVNSAMFSNYNNFTIQGQDQQTLYGLFQCRGDLASADCGRCVAHAVTQLGSLCLDSCGAALQLDACLVKYDNISFLGVEDKTVVLKKCGLSISYDSDALTRRDAVLGYLGSGDESYKPYRVGGSGDVTGVAQCVGDLSVSECQDCLSDAIGRLKTECGAARWGDMFLAKCYARYSEGGDHSHSHGGKDDNNDEEIEKTLAIIIGMIVGIALLIIFVSSIRKMCDGKGKGGK